jgi:hypothetical protein
VDTKTLKLIRHIVENPSCVTLEELVELTQALGGEVKHSKKGGFLKVPGETAFLYHRPHGRFMKPGAVKQFVQCAQLVKMLGEYE